MKMFKINLSLLSVFVLFCIACNDSTDEGDSLYYSYGNTMVKSFYLSSDTSVMEKLDKIFFTIDLRGGQIFNADSLPYGTKQRKFVLKMEFASPSKVEIKFNGKNDSGEPEEKTVNYLENPTDSIDFSEGKASMIVTSADGLYTQTYSIDVRIHQIMADSLQWGKMAQSALPVAFTGAPVLQKTLTRGGILYCFARDAAGNYSVSTCGSPSKVGWDKETFVPGTELDLTSVVASDDNFFALSSSKDLYASVDGVYWSAVSGVSFYGLIGMWQDHLTGIAQDGGTYKHALFSGADGFVLGDALESQFPVSGFSNIISYQSDWGTSQIAFVGGRLSNGDLTNSVWGYDGNTWASLNNVDNGVSGAPLTPREGAMFFPYYTYSYNSSLDIHTEHLTYFIIGGKGQDNGVLNDVYTSVDLAGYWSKATTGSGLEIPSVIEPRAFASAVVCMETADVLPVMNAWRMYDAPVLIKGMKLASGTSDGKIPYLYMFGGESGNGTLYNQVWRGVINRLTFPPIP